jgi:hypothetical protein
MILSSMSCGVKSQNSRVSLGGLQAIHQMAKLQIPPTFVAVTNKVRLDIIMAETRPKSKFISSDLAVVRDA